MYSRSHRIPEAKALLASLLSHRPPIAPFWIFATNVGALAAEIHYMHIGAETFVVCQIQTHMIWIVIDDDFIRISVQVIAATSVDRGNWPIPAARIAPDQGSAVINISRD